MEILGEQAQQDRLSTPDFEKPMPDPDESHIMEEGKVELEVLITKHDYKQSKESEVIATTLSGEFHTPQTFAHYF